MNVPFLDLKSQYLRLKPEIEEVFADIFERSAFICGKYVDLFEKKFAAAIRAKRFVATSSGTDAVHLMLWAAGIGPGDKVICPVESAEVYHIYDLFVVRVPAEKRDKLREFLQERNIATGLHYSIPMHLQKAYVHLGYEKGDFPVAERQANEILSLLIYPEMKDEQVEYVCVNIRRYFHG